MAEGGQITHITDIHLTENREQTTKEIAIEDEKSEVEAFGVKVEKGGPVILHGNVNAVAGGTRASNSTNKSENLTKIKEGPHNPEQSVYTPYADDSNRSAEVDAYENAEGEYIDHKDKIHEKSETKSRETAKGEDMSKVQAVGFSVEKAHSIVIHGNINVAAGGTQGSNLTTDIENSTKLKGGEPGKDDPNQSDKSTFLFDFWMNTKNADVIIIFCRENEGLKQAKEWLKDDHRRINPGLPIEIAADLGGKLHFKLKTEIPTRTISGVIPLTNPVFVKRSASNLLFKLRNSPSLLCLGNLCRMSFEIESFDRIGGRIDRHSTELNFDWPIDDGEEKSEELTKVSRFSKAITLFERLPSTEIQQLNLMECYFELNRNTDVLKCIDNIRTIVAARRPRPKAVDVFNIGLAYLKKSSHINAMTYFACACKIYLLQSDADFGIMCCPVKCKEVIEAMIKKNVRMRDFARDVGMEILNGIADDVRSLQNFNPDKKAEMVAHCLNDTGACHVSLKNFRRGIECYKSGIDIMNQQFGENTSKLLVFGILLNNLGVANYRLGSFAEAESLYNRAIDVYKEATWANDEEKKKTIKFTETSLRDARWKMGK